MTRLAQYSPTATVATIAMMASTSIPHRPFRRSLIMSQAWRAATITAKVLTSHWATTPCPVSSRPLPAMPTNTVIATIG